MNPGNLDLQTSLGDALDEIERLKRAPASIRQRLADTVRYFTQEQYAGKVPQELLDSLRQIVSEGPAVVIAPAAPRGERTRDAVALRMQVRLAQERVEGLRADVVKIYDILVQSSESEVGAARVTRDALFDALKLDSSAG